MVQGYCRGCAGVAVSLESEKPDIIGESGRERMVWRGGSRTEISAGKVSRVTRAELGFGDGAEAAGDATRVRDQRKGDRRVCCRELVREIGEESHRKIGLLSVLWLPVGGQLNNRIMSQ